MAAKGVLRTIEGDRLGFWCPGCRRMHVVGAGWKFNGDFNMPTFSPSVLVLSGHYADSDATRRGHCWCNFNERHPDLAPARFRCERCHCFVRDGQIQFLSDSTHELAGITVPLSAMEEAQDVQE